MNMVGGLGPGTLAPLNLALSRSNVAEPLERMVTGIVNPGKIVGIVKLQRILMKECTL